MIPDRTSATATVRFGTTKSVPAATATWKLNRAPELTITGIGIVHFRLSAVNMKPAVC